MNVDLRDKPADAARDPAPSPAAAGRVADRRAPGRPAIALALIAVGILGTALLLRTQHVSDISLDFDECCSWKISQFPWHEMLDAVSRDAHPPLYYVVLKLLTAVLGDSQTVLRGFSIAMGAGTVLAAWWFVQTATASDRGDLRAESGGSSFAALLAAALIALSGLHVEMSLRARPYALGTLLSLVTAAFLLRALRTDGRRGDWVGFALAAAALSLTHYYCLFTVAALFAFAAGTAVAEFWRNGWGAETKRTAIGLACSVWAIGSIWLIWLPTFRFQQSRSTPQLWMAPLDARTFNDTCYLALAGGESTVPPASGSWWGVAVWAGVAAALALTGTRSMRLTALCAATPPTAVVVYAIAVRNILGVKYLIFAQLFLLIGAAMLVGRVRRPVVRLSLAVGLVAWTGYWCLDAGAARDLLARSAGVQGAAAYLNDLRAPDEPVIVGSAFVHPIVQKYAHDQSHVLTIYHGDHRDSLLSGPPLRESEYRDVNEVVRGDAERIWTIDSFGMFRPDTRYEVQLPADRWELERQEEFRESNGIACVLAVRSYRRIRSESDDDRAANGQSQSVRGDSP